MIASLTGALGYAEMALGRTDEARAALERALGLNLAGGYRGRAADNRFALGNLHRKEGRLAESAAMYQAALADALDMEDAGRTLTYLAAIASWAADGDHLAEAVRLAAAVDRAASEQGGALGAIPGIGDPIAVSRERGLGEATIEAQSAIGQALAVEDAVAYAMGLLGGPVGEPARTS
jgi:tetratricopeptide (TPR) repeat protein